MIRKFKTLGLAMVAVLAMSAFVASAAQAQYTASSYPTTAKATSEVGNDVFTTEGGTVECKSEFEGTLSEASSLLTVKATYTSCKAFGFVSASVNMNGCAYVFEQDGENSTLSTATVECAGNASITVVAGNCEIKIAAQGPLSSVATHNNGAHVDAKANVEGIAYTVVKDGFLCPFMGTGAKAGGIYTQIGAVTLVPTVAGRTISVD